MQKKLFLIFLKLILLYPTLIKISFILYPNILAANPTLKSDQNIPKIVYRATPTKPEKVFENGFDRSMDLHTDLSRHIQGDSGDPSAFISTTSSLSYAEQFANSYAIGWWRTHEFYIYEIIPGENFVSVANTYERTLNEETNSTRLQALSTSFARRVFTREHEYSAIYEIPPERIISAIRYSFDRTEGRFIRGEEIINTVSRIDRETPSFTPSIHPNNYPLGTYLEYQYQYSGVSSGFACYDASPENEIHLLKKRNINTNEFTCPSTNSIKIEKIELPNSFFEKDNFKLKVEIFKDESYCLTPTDYNYLYINYCHKSNNWIYTEFGQLISEIYDGKNLQYYCLSSAREKGYLNYVKMEICDLNNKDQVWKLKINADSNYTILSSDQRYLNGYNNYYAYTSKFYDDYRVIKIASKNVIPKKRAKALIQFSVDPLMLNNKNILYPTAGKNVSVDNSVTLDGYKNYYNAHNNALFSSYGNHNEGPQICFLSSLLRRGGTSWGWVKDDYCSTQKKLDPEYKWYFKKNSQGYYITDFGDNVLRINDNRGSPNRYFAYNAFKYWTDKNSFVESFLLNQQATIYADHFSSTEMDAKNDQQKTEFSYNAIKEYFRKIYF